ncbi:hypothetical protein [Rufibacter roseolus]|uniref:hypothetical protein n=1 Tax=Rufibacter roseolus TaxID=2817375 RepID=UPI001B3108E3|nr:hypothetical protein [Rufibacter roseolus]
MKKLLLLSIFILVQFLALAQKEQPEISFVAYWEKGDVYKFKVTKLKQQWKNGTLAQNDSSQYVVNFEVIDSTESSYLIKWSYKNNVASTYDIPEALQEKFAKYDLTEIIYKTTETGQFVEVENWQQVADMMKSMFTDMIEVKAADNSISKADLEKRLQPMITAFNSKEAVEQFVLNELQYLHFPFGAMFPTSKTVEYDDELPNMFGGNPIKAKGKLSIESFDSEESRCVLVQQLKLNPKDTKEIVTLVLNKMGLKEKEVKAAMKTAKFDITDLNKYEYFYYPGVPIKIETKRETLLTFDKESGKRIDKVMIELVD